MKQNIKVAKELVRLAKSLISSIQIDNTDDRLQKNIYNDYSQLNSFRKQDKYIRDICNEDYELIRLEDDLYRQKITIDEFIEKTSKLGYKFDKNLIEYYLKKFGGKVFEEGDACNCEHCKYSVLGTDDGLYCNKYKDAFYFVSPYDLCDKFQESSSYGHRPELIVKGPKTTENFKQIRSEFWKFFNKKRNEYKKYNIKMSLKTYQETNSKIDYELTVSYDKLNYYDKPQRQYKYFDIKLGNIITLKTYDHNVFQFYSFQDLFDEIQQNIDVLIEKENKSKKYDQLLNFHKVNIGDLVTILQMGNYPKMNKVTGRVISKDKNNMTIDIMIGYRKKTIKPSDIIDE